MNLFKELVQLHRMLEDGTTYKLSKKDIVLMIILIPFYFILACVSLAALGAFVYALCYLWVHQEEVIMYLVLSLPIVAVLAALYWRIVEKKRKKNQ